MTVKTANCQEPITNSCVRCLVSDMYATPLTSLAYHPLWRFYMRGADEFLHRPEMNANPYAPPTQKVHNLTNGDYGYTHIARR